MKKDLIAACGINCSLCTGYQREKNKCEGCRSVGNKPKNCLNCIVVNCNKREGKEDFCFSCDTYPCQKIKRLANRYSMRYGVDIYKNLERIKAKGIKVFVEEENEKWKCIKCKALLCMHSKNCLKCGEVNPYYIGTL